MAKPKLLLIDFSNLLYRAVFANLSLSHGNEFTGGIYGFINMMSSTVNRYAIDRVVVCEDWKPYFRSKHYPEYKQDRGKDMSEDDIKRISVARLQIRKLVSSLHISTAAVRGYEADDFIGRFCRARTERHDGIYVLSNDSDFYQLLGGVAGSVFLVGRNGLYGQHQFKEDFPDIEPNDWPRVIALKGSHNGVAGIKGVGDKTAVKLVARGITEEEVFYKYQHLPSALELREALARFPYPLAPKPTLPRVGRIRYNAALFEEVCDEYGIRFKTEFHTAFLRLSQ